MPLKRKRYTLSDLESEAFDKLTTRAATGAYAWRFWQDVAAVRGLDYQTIIADAGGKSFTALSDGHGQYWCWPKPLEVKKPPQAYLTEVSCHG